MGKWSSFGGNGDTSVDMYIHIVYDRLNDRLHLLMTIIKQFVQVNNSWPTGRGGLSVCFFFFVVDHVAPILWRQGRRCMCLLRLFHLFFRFSFLVGASSLAVKFLLVFQRDACQLAFFRGPLYKLVRAMWPRQLNA